MKKRKIIVVGGLAAGPSAAAKAVRTNPGSEVILFESSDTVSYGICETPYAISGLIDDENKLVLHTPERLREEKGVDVKILHRAECINPSEHIINVRDLRNRSVAVYGYDKLILATGAKAVSLGLDGEDGRNVFSLRSRSDALAIINYLKTESPKEVVIIGGGYVGLEMAEAFRRLNCGVSILHRNDLPLDNLERETREKILQELLKNDVGFVPCAVTEGFHRDDSGKVRHVITNNRSFKADLVMVAAGVTPNVELARGAKIRLGESGAISADERQQTNIDDIYAAGDCSEVKNLVTGRRMYIPLASVASRTGRVAGENAAGNRAIYKGAVRAAAVKIFDLEVAHVGISSREAAETGFDVRVHAIRSKSTGPMMPGSENISVVLIIDGRTNRLLGANIYGGCGSALRADAISVAIQHHLTIDDASRLDMLYTPPFSPLWDPILTAANHARNKLSDL